MPKSALLGSPEVTTAIQRAIEAALAAVLQERQQQKQKKPTKSPPPGKVERQVAKAAAGAATHPRKRGFRGLPPPPSFDFSGLADSAWLTEYEVAAVGRWSTNTLGIWRQRPDHPLKWTRVGGGRVRYQVGALRAFLASGYRPQPGRPRKKDKDVAPAPKRTPKPPARRRADSAADDRPETPR